MHRLDHLRQQRCGGIGIYINASHVGFLLFRLYGNRVFAPTLHLPNANSPHSDAATHICSVRLPSRSIPGERLPPSAPLGKKAECRLRRPASFRILFTLGTETSPDRRAASISHIGGSH